MQLFVCYFITFWEVEKKCVKLCISYIWDGIFFLEIKTRDIKHTELTARETLFVFVNLRKLIKQSISDFTAYESKTIGHSHLDIKTVLKISLTTVARTTQAETSGIDHYRHKHFISLMFFALSCKNNFVFSRSWLLLQSFFFFWAWFQCHEN